jgi:hypothetical protein
MPYTVELEIDEVRLLYVRLSDYLKDAPCACHCGAEETANLDRQRKLVAQLRGYLREERKRFMEENGLNDPHHERPHLEVLK